MIATRLRHAAPVLAAACLLCPAVTPASAQPRTPATDTLRLGIAEAVTRVLRTSDEARIASALVELADAQVISARASAMPQVRLASTYSQVMKNARAELVGQVFGQPYTYNTNLLFQQSLFQGGRLVGASQVAARTERAARLTSEETHAGLAVEAQRTYLNAVFATRIVEIQRRNLQIADERLAQVEQLEAAGRASRYEVLRARVERANLEPLALQAENDRVVAELELKALAQVPVGQPLVLTTTLDVAVVERMAAAAADDVSPALVRPSVRAAEATAGAREAAVRVARADLLPTLNASFTLGYLALPGQNGLPTRLGDRGFSYCSPVPADTTTLPDRDRCQNNGWFPDRSFGVQFTWPLFDGFRAKGAIEVAHSQARIADLQVRQAREDAAIQLESARAAMTRARATFAARAGNVREAEEAFDLASLRFSRGIGTQLEVSDAQLALLTARSTEARATFDLYLAIAELARARARPIPLPDGSTIAPGTTR
jgi:outer membrane protein TolC